MDRPGWVEVGIPGELETLRGQIVRAALRVHRHLGPGFRESIYRRCLAHALANDGIPSREERWLGVEFEGLVLHDAVRTDLIVDERILVELKAVERIHPVHREQIVSYLKASGLSIGILLNFNTERLMKQGYDRFVHPRHLRPAQRPTLGSAGSRVTPWSRAVELSISARSYSAPRDARARCARPR